MFTNLHVCCGGCASSASTSEQSTWSLREGKASVRNLSPLPALQQHRFCSWTWKSIATLGAFGDVGSIVGSWCLFLFFLLWGGERNLCGSGINIRDFQGLQRFGCWRHGWVCTKDVACRIFQLIVAMEAPSSSSCGRHTNMVTHTRTHTHTLFIYIYIKHT